MEKMNRRNLFKLGAYAIASLPLFKSIKAVAAESLPFGACPVDPPSSMDTSKIAEIGTKRSNYILNSTKSTHKKYSDGAACGNCKFYRAKIVNGNFNNKEVDGYAKCSMLGNKYVSRCGWCNKYKKNKKTYELYKRLKA